MITALAVFFGWRAARAANETYALEAEPVIVVQELTAFETQAETEEARRRFSASTHYVVGATGPQFTGVSLRPFSYSDDPNFVKTGSVTQPVRRPIPVFAIQNVGRSPAVDIEISWNLIVSKFYQIPGLEGTGHINITAIAPQDTTYVRIENLLGAAVKLSVKPMGTQIDWRSVQRRKKKIAVIAAAPDFTLKSP